MTRWEYLVHVLPIHPGLVKETVGPREIQGPMNAHGNEGWELVSMITADVASGSSQSILLTFKRPHGEQAGVR